ncbi:platelet-activating factor acetylhydrolase IB subunit gamma [Staphylotrichum tortipilum]|uniref:Platelet-activating factor acetylhydrolase IB subunit gamma n=1 Tax=Staphylotrichum tortipilum TaxID=2831512 RepID=A0AAN6RTC6_9PEZI|nr:platelet-activating factor acetylhydrolase IB subunit gamma [Staphylotrichum longicolle]
MADANTPDAATGSSSATEQVSCPTLPLETAIANLRLLAKYKARSHETSKTTHIPLLQSCLGPDARPGPTVVFIGDSMIERMLTTGGSPNFPAPWPSPFLMDDEALASEHGPNAVRFDRAFNAGVGGDKIENLIYRLVGSEGNEDEEKNLPGLLPLFAEIGTVKMWVLQIGTNNLSPKKGMPAAYESMLQKVIAALLSIRRKDGAPSYVVATSLFPRKDVPTKFVRAANEWVKEASKFGQSQFGEGILDYLEAPMEFETGEELSEEVAKYLDDHVHLNRDGYRVWAHTLYGRVQAEMEQQR